MQIGQHDSESLRLAVKLDHEAAVGRHDIFQAIGERQKFLEREGTKPQLPPQPSLKISTMMGDSDFRFLRSSVRIFNRVAHSGRDMIEPLASRSDSRTR